MRPSRGWHLQRRVRRPKQRRKKCAGGFGVGVGPASLGSQAATPRSEIAILPEPAERTGSNTAARASGRLLNDINIPIRGTIAFKNGDAAMPRDHQDRVRDRVRWRGHVQCAGCPERSSPQPPGDAFPIITRARDRRAVRDWSSSQSAPGPAGSCETAVPRTTAMMDWILIRVLRVDGEVAARSNRSFNRLRRPGCRGGE